MAGTCCAGSIGHESPTRIASRPARAALLAGLVSLGLFAGGVPTATASPLSLTLLQAPDIISGFLDISYDAATDTLSVSGFALEIDDDGVGPAETINGGSFDLSASIDASGALSGGSVSIGGTIPSLGYSGGTLLTGTLTAFGFPDLGGDPLELLFDVTGGELAALYGAGSVGIILGDTGFGGSFANSFDNLIAGMAGTGTGVSNTAPLPEPTTGALLTQGLVGLAWSGRRRPARAASR